MSKPAADVELSVPLVRELIHEQHADLAHLPVTAGPSGWDNDLYRLGDDMAVRLPRRAIAAGLLAHEQRWLPLLQRQLPLRIPAPIRLGKAASRYPWIWSITPWFPGETLDRVALADDQIEGLTAFLRALHVPAPPDAPHNPGRCRPLSEYQEWFERGVAAVADTDWAVDGRLLQIWERAVRAPYDQPATWIHGDLHSRNVLAQAGRLTAVIDWGDMARGDRAVDLATNWMVQPDAEQREQFMRFYTDATPATWDRARAWALLYALNVLRADDAEHRLAGQQTLQRLHAGP